MGEEYADPSPFLYFVSHSDPALVDAVRKGRSDEFAAFQWQGEVPDPQAEHTFERSMLNRAVMKNPPHRQLRDYYCELIRTRKAVQPIRLADKRTMEVREFERTQTLYARFWHGTDEAVLLLTFARAAGELELPFPAGHWRKRLDSTGPSWGGAGSTVPDSLVSHGLLSLRLPPQSVLLFQKC
jgi:maltooligosyltrehalose trehalohydrolase